MEIGAILGNWWWTFVLGGVGACLTAAWAGMRRRVKREVSEQKAIKVAVLAILHDRLRQACMHQLKVNRITPSDLDNLRKMVEGYSGLGGNGTVKELYERCTKLPLGYEGAEFGGAQTGA